MPQTFSGDLGGGVIQPETRKTVSQTQTAIGAGLINVIDVRDIIRPVNRKSVPTAAISSHRMLSEMSLRYAKLSQSAP